MNVNLFIIKDYRKKDDFAVRKNKPNSNPILSAVGGLQMNVSSILTKDYENKPRLRAPGKQTQSNPIRVQDFAVRPCGLNALHKLYTIKILFLLGFTYQIRVLFSRILNCFLVCFCSKCEAKILPNADQLRRKNVWITEELFPAWM